MSERNPGSRDNTQDPATVDESVRRNRPPVASVRSPGASAAVDDTFVFDGSGSADPDGEIVRHEWAVEVGDEVVAGDTGPTFAYAFERPGIHRVHCTVTDDDGAWDTATARVRVEDPLGDSPA